MESKILLFYKYIDITYPKQILKWQKKLCAELDLHGRIILAHEGINGTIGGSIESCNRYIEIMNSHPLFDGIDFKESPGGKDDFPRMRILIKNEICHLGLDTEKYHAKDGGIHLTPSQTHELITNNKDLVILDARNDYEAQIGTFENAIIPPIQNFRELPNYIDNNLDQFKDKEVLMFCTGGIRCERASTYLKSKNVATKVYQIEGGIHRYIEQFPDGYFRGKNYVFDERIAVKANDDILGTCHVCGITNDDYTNCINAECNKHYISCSDCLTELQNCCSEQCRQLVSNKQVVIRKKPLPGIQYKQPKH